MLLIAQFPGIEILVGAYATAAGFLIPLACIFGNWRMCCY